MSRMAQRVCSILVSICSIIGLLSCALPKKDTTQESQLAQVQRVVQTPLSPEESQEMLKDVGENWLYGQGLGETALNVGTIVAFPPFALWVLGNAALSLGGYESIHVSDAFPEDQKDAWLGTYDSVTSGPGRFTAAVAGKEFRNKEVAKERLNKYIKGGAASPN